LLDYDGTLVPIAQLPDLATPDDALLELLERLASAHATDVHVITGRARESIEPWLGKLPVTLHAEHGYWSRSRDGLWVQCKSDPPAFLERAVQVLRKHALVTPGALVEPKAASVAFHYRRSDPHLAEARVRALREELGRELGADVDLLEGHKVLEVRMRGVHKGVVGRRVVSELASETAIFAAGDDRTDEDLFGSLPEHAVTVRVGPGKTRASLRVASPHELRRLLFQLIG
jgi:trehalose 6-phosphate synthase/phosphatase